MSLQPDITPIRRRTPEERDAYLDGFKAGAEYALEMVEHPGTTYTAKGAVLQVLNLIRASTAESA